MYRSGRDVYGGEGGGDPAGGGIGTIKVASAECCIESWVEWKGGEQIIKLELEK